MRMLAFAAGISLLVVGLSAAGAGQAQELKGHLMDIACSSHHASEAGYTESHDKSACSRTPASRAVIAS